MKQFLMAFNAALTIPLALLTACSSNPSSSPTASPSSAPSPSIQQPAAPKSDGGGSTNLPRRSQTEADPPIHSSADDFLREAAAKPIALFDGEGWQSLFDGKTLTGWSETKFAGRGEVECKHGLLIFNMGDPFTGVNGTNDFPKMNYEIAFDAMRVMGSDFFCGLTLPMDTNFFSLIVGGWGGGLVGISSLDGMDASENETTKFGNFEQGHWYRIRLRVTKDRIEGWIDNEKLIDVVTADKKISVRAGDIEMSIPFGLAAWQTSAALREIKLRPVSEPASRKPKGL